MRVPVIAASLRNVTRMYGAGATIVPALRDASVEILANRFTVLRGPSGSGKTTMLNLFGGIDRATSGRVIRPFIRRRAPSTVCSIRAAFAW